MKPFITISAESSALPTQLNSKSIAIMFLMGLLLVLLLIGAGGFFTYKILQAQESLQKTVAAGQNELHVQVEDLKKSTEAIDCRLIYLNQPTYKGNKP